MTINVREYVREDGSNPFRSWFRSITDEAAVKVTEVQRRLAQGNTSGLKPLRGGVSEWRIDWAAGIRVYVYQDGAELVLLLGGSVNKQTQPKKINEAVELATEYKLRKKKLADEAAAAAKSDKRENVKDRKRRKLR